MTPADRAAWLARVEGMTREQRIAALYAVVAGFDLPPEQHDHRALDLIHALERDAAAKKLEEAGELIESGCKPGWSSERAIARGLKLKAQMLRADIPVLVELPAQASITQPDAARTEGA